MLPFIQRNHDATYEIATNELQSSTRSLRSLCSVTVLPPKDGSPARCFIYVTTFPRAISLTIRGRVCR